MPTIGRTEIFVEVARRQSFAKAAKALGITGPAASKQVMALEAELGVKLLHRTTRLVTLTDEGHIYYESARLALEQMQDAAEQLRNMRMAPQGALKISAPVSFSLVHLLPVLSGFAKKYPDITLEIVLDDKMIDVLAEGFDIAIRVGAPTDSSLICRHLAACPPHPIVASPAYLEQHGLPETPADLKQHRMIAYTNQGGTAQWHYRTPQGRTGMFRYTGAFRSNNASMMLQAALDGVGIAILPMFCVATHLQAGQLVQLLPDYETLPQRHICALMPPNRYRLAKVNLLLDWIAQSCKAMPLDI
ncbi:MAG TPA: LysR family transcriptional regulator [Rickettsiales bacterium]|nr:LysR family transcriptional regulator [Rickettsiales bacterium]